jgi:hypothetical protein
MLKMGGSFMAKHKSIVTRISAEATAELHNLERLLAELQEITPAQTSSKRLVLRATASLLADFYNGVERTIKIILSELDDGLPRGENWHRQLLVNAKIATGMRPPIISERMFNKLVPFLGFRHVVRNAYGFELDPERVNQLTIQLSDVFADFQKEIIAFLEKITGLV